MGYRFEYSVFRVVLMEKVTSEQAWGLKIWGHEPPIREPDQAGRQVWSWVTSVPCTDCVTPKSKSFHRPRPAIHIVLRKNQVRSPTQRAATMPGTQSAPSEWLLPSFCHCCCHCCSLSAFVLWWQHRWCWGESVGPWAVCVWAARVHLGVDIFQ